MQPYNKKLKLRAQELRKNMTKSECLLWKYLRKKQILNAQFYRQTIIEHYIVDFYCPKYKLIIEVDGIQHSEEEQKEYDDVRTEDLGQLGLEVLRFTNREILNNAENVVDRIRQKMRE